MLVLMRKIGETITIGDNVKVTVLKIENGKVRLGVTADRSIPVHKGETFEKIKEVREQE